MKSYDKKLIANPNCSTAIAILPLKKLDELYSIKRIIFTTFQAVSGSGKKGLDELYRCKNGLLPSLYDGDISKNCIAKIGKFAPFGYTDEELKMVNETQKIFNKRIEISATCVRVPLENCHGISVEVEFEKPYFDEEIKGILRAEKGLKVTDLPLFDQASGKDEVFIGRLKRSHAFKSGLSYFCIGDNTLKGAVLNAIQIAELLITFNKFE